jgi:hypothetical protein
MTKKTNTHHVVHDKKDDVWKVVRGNAERASGCYETKQQAVDSGREISQHQHTELKIHNMNGKISQSDSHGHDPYPPKG